MLMNFLLEEGLRPSNRVGIRSVPKWIAKPRMMLKDLLTCLLTQRFQSINEFQGNGLVFILEGAIQNKLERVWVNCVHGILKHLWTCKCQDQMSNQVDEWKDACASNESYMCSCSADAEG